MSSRKSKNARPNDGKATKDARAVLKPGNSGRKHKSRQFRSNSDKCKSVNVEDAKVEEEKMDDFARLMNSPSDCNYFQFKSEKSWEDEAAYSSFSGHEFFNLDLELLSNGLACIPFYERVGIEKSLFSRSDIERCDKKANGNLPRYNLVRDRFVRKLEKDYELPESVQEAIGLLSKPKMTTKMIEPQITLSDLSESLCESEASPENMENASETVADETVCEENGEQNEVEEENLEDWLDSVLDD